MAKKGSVTANLDQRIYDLIHKLLDDQTEDNKQALIKELQQQLHQQHSTEEDEDGDIPQVNVDELDSFKYIALAKDLRVTEVLPYVQQKDFQMRRMKRATLEKSIESVLEIIRDDEQEELGDVIRQREEEQQQKIKEQLDLDSDFENLDESNMMDVKDSNSLNKSVVNSWNLSANNDNGTGTTTGATTGATTGTTTGTTTSTMIATGTTSNDNESTGISDDKKRKRKEVNKSNKKLKKIDHTPPTTKLSNLGGMEKVTTDLMELIGLPILHPEIYVSTGVEPPRGVLLYGPPGCGKTTIANALAGELQVPFLNISAPSIVSGMSGESEKKLREIFEEAKNLAPCLVFMDEIDAITPKRDGGAQREMERRIVAQLLTLMDELTLDKTNNKPVIVIGATNRPDSLDSALRRAGRFDREICLNVPNEQQRASILKTMTKNLKLFNEDQDFNFQQLAKLTPGFVGADLKSLVTASGIFAIKRIFEDLSEQDFEDSMDIDQGKEPQSQEPQSQQLQSQQLQVQLSNTTLDAFNDKPDPEKLSIIQKFLIKHPNPLSEEQLKPLSIIFQDFLNALPTIQPTAKREGFATIPDVTWDNVGALAHIRMELHMCIVQPIKKPEIFEKVGITAPAGVLMWGPPGCGKTLLAKAVANESRANFISIKGPELLNKYVGESERAIRQVFQRARASVPCVIFFDELDALVPKRDNSLSESSSRVVNTLLTELDGLNDRKGIFVIGATNRPDIIDPAMIRPGRLDKSLYIELPTEQEKLEILTTLITINKTPIETSVNLQEIVYNPKCKNFSGADLSSLVREAGVIALKRNFFQNQEIKQLDKSGYIYDNSTNNSTDNSDLDSIRVTQDDFYQALKNINPSVSDKDRAKYERLNRKMAPVMEEPKVEEES